MSALEAPRDTPRLGTSPVPELFTIPLAADAVIFVGALVGVNADGYLDAASEDDDLKIVGRAETGGDNTGGDDGDVSCQVRAGTFKWENGTDADEIAQADLGEYCFAKDDQTVTKHGNAGARPVAGIIVGVDDDGIWVESGFAISAALRSSTGVDDLS